VRLGRERDAESNEAAREGGGKAAAGHARER
jgi:hypothetical protein